VRVGGWWEKLKLIQQLAKEVPRCATFKILGGRDKSLGPETECVASILKLVDTKGLKTKKYATSDQNNTSCNAYPTKLPPIKTRFEQLNSFFDGYEATKEPAPFQLMGCKLGRSSNKLCCLGDVSLNHKQSIQACQSINQSLSKPSQLFLKQSKKTNLTQLARHPQTDENADPQASTQVLQPVRRRKSVRRTKTLRMEPKKSIFENLEERLEQHMRRLLKQEYRL
jgi:hypothetical protein